MYGFEGCYYSEREGINSRLDELQAAMLRVKLRHLPQWLTRRRALANVYDSGLPAGVRPVAAGEGVGHAYHLYVVNVAARDRVRDALSAAGVDTGIHYPFPVHRMAAYRFLGYEEGSLPVTERMARSILSLPMYPELPDPDALSVCARLRAALT
jgi:dTDP-3-amino-2,3,6-trideoxy-4-keto-D-glucose/dTDP-3-amino-3,4,6-trideoxy-alpha-D-glucose/dTDP-2,6-dideoxy-D-kanosamine transaminase